VAALARARARGVATALVTGRRYAFALPVARELGIPVGLISSNGALVLAPGGALVDRRRVPRVAARAVLARLGAYRALTTLAFDRDGRGALVVEETAALAAFVPRWLQLSSAELAVVAPLEAALDEDPIQLTLAGPISRMAEARRLLDAPDVAGLVTVLRTEYPARDLGLLDLLAAGCSKGSALARLAAHLGVPLGAVMAIGDNFNDLEMLERVGHPVVMGNACAELRAAGYPVTLTNDEAGVAAAVDGALQ
jgi:hypothetical protein